MTRLQALCILHKQQGGTIFQFNKLYSRDFISMSQGEWKKFVKRFINKFRVKV